MEQNSLFKIDDLYWNDEEQKYVLLSEEEYHAVLQSCMDSGFTAMQDIMKAIRWAEKVRASQLMLNGVLSKRIEFVGFKKKEPAFKEIE